MSKKSIINIIPDAWEDYESLDDSLLDEVEEYLSILEDNCFFGQSLQDKNGKDLSNCRKIYFNNYKHRIVYFIDSNGTVHISNIIAIGARADEEVYIVAHERLQSLGIK